MLLYNEDFLFIRAVVLSGASPAMMCIALAIFAQLSKGIPIFGKMPKRRLPALKVSSMNAF